MPLDMESSETVFDFVLYCRDGDDNLSILGVNLFAVISSIRICNKI